MVQPWIEPGDLDSPSDPYAEYAIDMATFVLWSLSGRKYHGTRTITEHYICPQFEVPLGCTQIEDDVYRNPNTGLNSYVIPPYLTASTTSGTRWRLRQQPIQSITSVYLGGELLPSGSYYVRDRSELVLMGCSSLCEGPIVTYDYGVKPPYAGKLAAIELANELVNSYNGAPCNLPERTQSIQRQGLTIEILDPEQFLDNGRTGIFKVDLFLYSANPAKAKKPAKTFNPDIPRGHTRDGGNGGPSNYTSGGFGY